MIKALALVVAIAACPLTSHRVTAQQTKNVVLIVTDGLRWQEVFTGGDSTLTARQPAPTRDAFWRPSPSSRRETLMPFLWHTVAREGTLFGDRTIGSIVRVSNGRDVSYPGYNEMLTGRVDPRIRDNDAGKNRNTTVLDWLQSKSEFSGRVAAYGTWETFSDIFNHDRAQFVMRVGWREPYLSPRTAVDSAIDLLYRSTRHDFDDVAPDALMQKVVLNDLRVLTPRVMFVGYGETDEWAHSGRYDEVLRATHAVDSLIAELWTTLQSMPVYRGVTTMIITTDHGRGATLKNWRDHNARTRGSDETWLAVIGPDTPAMGDGKNDTPIVTAQIAATIAALLGQDAALRTTIAPPISAVIRR